MKEFSWFCRHTDSQSVRYPATHTGKGKKLSGSVFYWVIQKKILRVCDIWSFIDDMTLSYTCITIKRSMGFPVQCWVRTSKGCFPTYRDCTYDTTSTSSSLVTHPPMLRIWPNFNCFINRKLISKLTYDLAPLGRPRFIQIHNCSKFYVPGSSDLAAIVYIASGIWDTWWFRTFCVLRNKLGASNYLYMATTLMGSTWLCTVYASLHPLK